MTRPRKELVCLDDTPYYHVICRCVRRAFLCGVDRYSGHSYEHRRGWIQARLDMLCRLFGIELCAYAIMSNHYHLVVRLNPKAIAALDDAAVIDRWGQVFSLPLTVQRWRQGVPISIAERQVVNGLVRLWRERLMSLSWFMRCLNEGIARTANAEDDCTGRFWEGRFKSQALLDEKALLTCMAYVDLNPIRAGIANTPETSDYTAIQRRIGGRQTPILVPFHSRQGDRESLPFYFPDYLELVDWTGRAILANRPGAIPEFLPRILRRLAIPQDAWRQALDGYADHFHTVIGPLDKLKARCARLRQHWLCGLGGAKLLYSVPPRLI